MAIIKTVMSGDIITKNIPISGNVEVITQRLNGDINVGDITPSYTGEYEFTPSNEIQIIEISGKVALENITINPIPEEFITEISLDNWDRMIAYMIYMQMTQNQN